MAVEKYVQQSRRFYEKDVADHSILFPEAKNLIRFSEMEDDRWGDGEHKDIMDSMSAAVTLTTDKIQLKKYAIFIERFFNHRDIADIADQMNIPKHAVRQNYHDAVRDLETIIQVLDNRGHASKHVLRKDSNVRKFTWKEKAFLLCYVFHFTHQEVAEILGFTRVHILRNVKTMEKKFRAAFDDAGVLA
jgi:DNA-directed RNA polymerase specialized sigma24 family protein